MNSKKKESLMLWIAECAKCWDQSLKQKFYRTEGSGDEETEDLLADWNLLTAAVLFLQKLQQGTDKNENGVPTISDVRMMSNEDKATHVSEFLRKNNSEQAVQAVLDQHSGTDWTGMKICALIFVTGVLDSRTAEVCQELIRDKEAESHLAHIVEYFNGNSDWPQVLSMDIKDVVVGKVSNLTVDSSSSSLKETPKRKRKSDLNTLSDGELFESPLKAALDSPLARNQKELRAKDNEIRSLKAERAELQHKYEESTAANQELRQTLEQERSQKTNLRSQLQILKGEQAQRRKPVESPDTKDDLRKRVHELLEKNKELEVEMFMFGKMEKELEDHKDMHDQLKSKCEELGRKLERKQKEMDKIIVEKEDILQAQVDQCKEAEKQIQVQQDEIRKLRDMMDEFEHTSAKLRKLEEDRGKLSVLTCDQSDKIKELQDWLDSEKKLRREQELQTEELNCKLTSEVARSKELEARLGETEQEREEAKRTRNRLSVSYESLNADSGVQLFRLQQSLDAERAKNKTLEKQLEETQDLLSKKQTELRLSIEATTLAQEQNHELFEKRQKMHGKIVKLQDIESNLNLKLIQLESESGLRGKYLEETEKNLKATEQEMEGTKQRFTEAKTELKLEKRKKEDLEKEILTLKQDLTELTDRLRDAVQDMEDTKAVLAASERRAKEEDERAEQNREELMRNMSVLEDKLTTEKLHSEKLQGNLKVTKEDLESLKQAMIIKERELAEVHDLLTEQTEKAESTEKELEEMAGAWNRKEELYKTDKETFTEERRKLKAENSSLRGNNWKYLSKISEQEQQLNSLSVQLNQEKEQTGCLEEEITQLRQKLASVMDKLNATIKSKDLFASKLRSAESTVSRLEAELERKSEHNYGLEREVTELKEFLKAAEEERDEKVKTYEEKVTALSVVEGNLQKKVKELTENNDATLMELKSEQKTTESLKAELKNKTEEMFQIQNSCEELKTCYGDKQEELNSIRKEYESEKKEWASKINEKNDLIESLENETESLRQELQQATDDVEASQLAAQEAAASKASMEQELSALRSRQDEPFVRGATERMSVKSSCPSVRSRRGSLTSQGSYVLDANHQARFGSGEDEADVLEELSLTPIVAPSSSHSQVARPPVLGGSVHAVVVEQKTSNPAGAFVTQALVPNDLSAGSADNDLTFKFPDIPKIHERTRNGEPGSMNESYLRSEDSAGYDVWSRATVLADRNKQLPSALRTAYALELSSIMEPDGITEDRIKAGTLPLPPQAKSTPAATPFRGSSKIPVAESENHNASKKTDHTGYLDLPSPAGSLKKKKFLGITGHLFNSSKKQKQEDLQKKSPNTNRELRNNSTVGTVHPSTPISMSYTKKTKKFDSFVVENTPPGQKRKKKAGNNYHQ